MRLKWWKCEKCGLEVCGYMRGGHIAPKLPQSVPPPRRDFARFCCTTCGPRPTCPACADITEPFGLCPH